MFFYFLPILIILNQPLAEYKLMPYYLIEFRFFGYARRYINEINREISRKFHIRCSEIPHITLAGPFTLSRKPFPLNLFLKGATEDRLVEEFTEVMKGGPSLITFKLKNFNSFPDTKVVYVDIEPSENLKQLRFELYKHLEKFCKLKKYDKASKDDFKFHATLAMKIPSSKFDSVWEYLKNNKPKEINQHLLRVALIRNQQILCEYDLIQKRLLSRMEAKSRLEFRRTIEMLKNSKGE
jgi:2'-5' RNA ligase